MYGGCARVQVTPIIILSFFVGSPTTTAGSPRRTNRRAGAAHKGVQYLRHAATAVPGGGEVCGRRRLLGTAPRLRRQRRRCPAQHRHEGDRQAACQGYVVVGGVCVAARHCVIALFVCPLACCMHTAQHPIILRTVVGVDDRPH